MADDRPTLTVTAPEARRRLDQFLAARFPHKSRSYLQKLIRDGCVSLVPGADNPPEASVLTRAGRPMTEGETVAVVFPPPEPSGIVPEALPLTILHEDDALIVIDKPSGVVVHPAAGARSGTLVHGLLHHCRDLSGIGGVERPGIVHRLDKETSGVLVAAKTDAAHRDLSRQFQDRTVEKIYLALVWGRMRNASGSIDLPIGRDTRQRVKISARTSRPRQARTDYRVIESLGEFSLVEARPRTGRTHQIRVHLSHLGHPVVGDAVYGGARWSRATDPAAREALRRFGRLALHALSLGFVHPSTGRPVRFETPAPRPFEELLRALRRS